MNSGNRTWLDEALRKLALWRLLALVEVAALVTGLLVVLAEVLL